MLAKERQFTISAHQHDGLSGKKFIAIRKKDGKKFFVKKETPSNIGDVRNEFVYHSLMKELGLPYLEVFLFERYTTNRGFDVYAVGIEFIDGVRLTNDEIKRNAKINMAHLVGFYALAGAFADFDSRIEILIDKQNRIFRIDTAESLFRNPSTLLAFQYKYIIETFGQEYGHHFITTVQAIADLPFSKIEAVLDELCEVFPISVKNYYIDYITKSKDPCKAFFAEHKQMRN